MMMVTLDMLMVCLVVDHQIDTTGNAYQQVLDQKKQSNDGYLYYDVTDNAAYYII